MSELFTLYGAQISIYTAKLRSYLTFKRILFQEVLPTLYVFERILIPVIGFRMMPVLRTPEGTLLQDSTLIIDLLEQRFPDRPVYPSTPRQHLAALLLDAYAHDWLYIVAMYTRWTFPAENDEFIAREFGRLREPTAQPDDQRAIGERGCALPRERLPMAGVTERTRPGLKIWTKSLLAHLDAHFVRHDFLLGGRPCTADFALMGPLYGHLFRDPQSARLMRQLAPNVLNWIARMNLEPQGDGDYLVGDEVPDTLFPLLNHARQEYLPAAYDVIRRVGVWVEENPGMPIPRTLGEHEVLIAGVREKRAVWTQIQYMAQRPLRLYQAAVGSSRTEMDRLLTEIGGDTKLDFRIAHWLVRKNHQLTVS
jgi:glutathione S-transferase